MSVQFCIDRLFIKCLDLDVYCICILQIFSRCLLIYLFFAAFRMYAFLFLLYQDANSDIMNVIA